MSRLKVKPICAAIMLMSAYGAPALAQTTPAATATATDSAAASLPADASAPAAASAAAQAPATAVVEVTGLRQSLRSAETIKRDAVQVVDANNADDIGKFPDRQAGDALQRVAGV